MDTIKSLVQPLVGGYGNSSIVDGMKLVVLGGTVETARRVSSSAWSHFVNSFFLTAHFSEEDVPYDWLMLWLSRRPEWQRSREFETTTRASGPGGPSATNPNYSEEDRDWDAWEAVVDQSFPTPYDEADSAEDPEGKPKTRIVFQPTYDTTHTIYYRGHWLRVRRGKRQDTGCEMLSISVVARSNAILKQLVLQAKKEYEAESVHRIQIYFADIHGSWRWTDSRHKRPLSSIVLNQGVKESLVDDTKDFLRSEKWYADRGIPFRRGYLLHGVPGSGKSSLIHALAGQLGLDIYVVSLSASWISDNTLMTLMGRVPARCVLLLEDLDAAFVRSTTREEGDEDGEGEDGENGGSGGAGGNDSFPGFTSGFWSGNSSSSGGGFSSSYGYSSSRSRRSNRYRSDGLSDMNTLSLSGLLNALDGVAASEGRLLFATTNHLERLDPALSRPGRMDVWVEFRNASQWQAEALFRNFFPCEEEEEVVSSSSSEDGDIDIEKNLSVLQSVPSTPTRDGGRDQTRRFVPSSAMMRDLSVSSTASERRPLPAPASTSSLWSLSTSIASSASSLLSGYSSPISAASPAMSTPPLPSSPSTAPISQNPLSSGFGSTNTAYLPPPPVNPTKPKPLDKKTLAVLAKKFADGVPEEEFSVASLQGYLLKHKAQPEAAANSIEAWVKSEKEMKERLQREKEAREVREKALREKRRKEAQEKDKVKKEKEKKEKELETVKALLAEKEKEEELEKMRQQLKDKEEELRKKEEDRKKKEEGIEDDPKDESKSEEESKADSDEEETKEETKDEKKE
ncbi:hypothetical protein CPB83DRAFT_897770 [Crepidotus variabilis]|uniref:P-loop containing nucleoside triphosphate hydrolase protein n=1 Tax=Crepidotus variabilis TaxID=179855 RepID=A0A9P6E8W4_9AGAR|nr:hypothetical protein CPB83DRAFT_897770 [Crepidotus variabilis]